MAKEKVKYAYVANSQILSVGEKEDIVEAYNNRIKKIAKIDPRLLTVYDYPEVYKIIKVLPK